MANGTAGISIPARALAEQRRATALPELAYDWKKNTVASRTPPEAGTDPIEVSKKNSSHSLNQPI